MGLMDGVNAAVGGAVNQLSKDQEAMIAAAPPEMQKFMRAQMEMQKQQELVQFITQMMKQLHEMAMSVIRNIGG